MSASHPKCDPVHICQRPSERVCIEDGCEQQAGTWWGPYWCPEHDKARLERISAQMNALLGTPEPDVERGDLG